MKTVSVEDVGQFGTLIDEAAREGEIVITRGGQPVARLTPVAAARRSEGEIAETIRAIKEHSRRVGATATAEEIVAWKNEGRK